VGVDDEKEGIESPTVLRTSTKTEGAGGLDKRWENAKSQTGSREVGGELGKEIWGESEKKNVSVTFRGKKAR